MAEIGWSLVWADFEEWLDETETTGALDDWDAQKDKIEELVEKYHM